MYTVNLGEVFKETTGGDAEDSDLNDAKENGKKATIEKDGKLTT